MQINEHFPLCFYTVQTVYIIFEDENNLSGLWRLLIDQLSCVSSISPTYVY